MQYHKGRLIDHLHLRVRDLAATRRFYEAVLPVVGVTLNGGDGFLYADELYFDEGPKPSRCHLAFQAPDRKTVDRFHAAALKAGGRDKGAPGPRDYHPGYYGCFVLDPDGNNIEAVWHGPSERSSESILITRL